MHLSARLGSCQVGEASLGADGLTDFFMELQVYGTPQQCYDRIKHIHEQSQCCASINAFKFGGRPFEDAQASLRLFAEEVMPELGSVSL